MCVPTLVIEERVGWYIKLSCNYTYKCFNCGRTQVRVVAGDQFNIVYERRLESGPSTCTSRLVQYCPDYGNVREVKRSSWVKSRAYTREVKTPPYLPIRILRMYWYVCSIYATTHTCTTYSIIGHMPHNSYRTNVCKFIWVYQENACSVHACLYVCMDTADSMMTWKPQFVRNFAKSLVQLLNVSEITPRRCCRGRIMHLGEKEL